MQIINAAVLTILISIPVLSIAEDKEGKSFVSDARPFILINNVNRQAEAWAACSAVWDFMAMLTVEDSEAQAKQYSNMGYGAKMAVAMSFVSDLVKADDFDKDRFEATWRFAQTAAKSMPDVKMTAILADSESRGADAWSLDLGATITVCKDNLEGQQAHVDGWRALATSGLLKFE